ncbi:MAG: hypothetical protein JST82_11280 [Bacteroidetes bacterium]|nr:hypothetical protein [Bacteroidota bacterium]
MKKKQKKRKAFTRQNNIRYIVVHTTGTRPSIAFNELDKLNRYPYHYIITPHGKLLNLRPLLPSDGTIEIALMGGLNKEGIHADTRTEAQNDCLFTTLVLLTEHFPEAVIKAADELYQYGFANPGFNVKEWLANYIPAFLIAA